MDDGTKSLRKYSKPFDLSRYSPTKWVTEKKDLDWLVEALDGSQHFEIAPPKTVRQLRKASKLEVKAINITEWPHPSSS